jgi:hypothetical protein
MILRKIFTLNWNFFGGTVSHSKGELWGWLRDVRPVDGRSVIVGSGNGDGRCVRAIGDHGIRDPGIGERFEAPGDRRRRRGWSREVLQTG